VYDGISATISSNTSLGDTPGDVLHDLPVWTGLPWRVRHLAAELHPAVGVGVGAVLLHVGGGGKNHVGELGGLGEEDVLNHEEVQGREGLAHLVDVRVGEERVLAEHVHATHAVGLQHRFDDLRDRQAAVRVERRAPGLLEARLRRLTVDALVIGIEHRDQARVGRTLHVVLPAQRVQTGAGTPDLPGD
jgi:hypothetical protein